MKILAISVEVEQFFNYIKDSPTFFKNCFEILCFCTKINELVKCLRFQLTKNCDWTVKYSVWTTASLCQSPASKKARAIHYLHLELWHLIVNKWTSAVYFYDGFIQVIHELFIACLVVHCVNCKIAAHSSWQCR